MTGLSSKKEHCFFFLFEKFISDCKKGRRIQPNGKKLSEGTISNYGYALKLVKKFSEKNQFYMRVRSVRRLTSREMESEKNYWKKFQKQFSKYLYDDLGHFDNYVGQCMKNIKVFFGYLNKELMLSTGEFHKLFFVRKEEISIFPLMPEELNFLIYNKEFEISLSRKLRETKDFFVFGCTVALRVSDLFALEKPNIRIVNGYYYLAVRSKKTSIDSLIKLPDYAVEIVLRYKKQKKKLLPQFNKVNLNKYIKILLAKAGFTHAVNLTRERRGKLVELKNNGKPYRFCDVASTHTMRRTAITTMLCLGMNEQLVRKISGHSPDGKEFYRYVLWAQAYQDQESQKMFEKLKEMQLKMS